MFFDLLSVLFGKIFFFTGLIQNKGTFPKPLSPEDEKKYLALSRAGDKEAKEILIKHNMRLVAHVVKKYAGSAETDDLLSVGSIGLIKAINTFQDGKGTQLATYTARCIENEILMLIRSSKKHKNIIVHENITKMADLMRTCESCKIYGGKALQKRQVISKVDSPGYEVDGTLQNHVIITDGVDKQVIKGEDTRNGK